MLQETPIFPSGFCSLRTTYGKLVSLDTYMKLTESDVLETSSHPISTLSSLNRVKWHSITVYNNILKFICFPTLWKHFL